MEANSERYWANREIEAERSRVRGAVYRRLNPESKKASHDAWVKRNPEKDVAAKRKWADAHPDYKRSSHMLRRYGVTREDYLRLLQEQAGACRICKSTEPRGNRKVMVVDHDHATGKVRGLLCHTCNAGLGHFRDNPAMLRAAIAYLEGQ